MPDIQYIVHDNVHYAQTGPFDASLSAQIAIK